MAKKSKNETEKTVEEWFKTLPEPYRTKALEGSKIQGRLELKATNLAAAVSAGIHWKDTEQGFEYWNKVSCTLLEGKRLW